MTEPDCPCWKDHRSLMEMQTETAGAVMTTMFSASTTNLCAPAREHLISLILYGLVAVSSSEKTGSADLGSRENCDAILELADQMPAMIRARMAALRLANAESGGRTQ